MNTGSSLFIFLAFIILIYFAILGGREVASEPKHIINTPPCIIPQSFVKHGAKSMICDLREDNVHVDCVYIKK